MSSIFELATSQGRNVPDWSTLWSFSNFEWKYGSTPFSEFKFPFFSSLGYLALIFILQKYMSERKKLELRLFSTIHNLFLVILSSAMFLGSIVGIIKEYKNHGFFNGLFCDLDLFPSKDILFYWCYIFYLSKYYEFIDTFILIFKKKPVIFLHAYHHFVMVYVCWAGLEGKWTLALWSSTIFNSFVHVIMYTYYFLQTLGYDVWWKRYLTSLQISQFVYGVTLTLLFLYYYLDFKVVDGVWQNVTPCSGEPVHVTGMAFVNFSFLILFVKFYFDTYKSKPSSKSKDITKKD